VIMTKDFGMSPPRTADLELPQESRAQSRSLRREIDTAVRGVVEAAMRDGSIAPADPRLVTFTVTGALNWIARWYDPNGPLSPDSIADGCVAALVAGLAPRPARKTAR